jgi:uncharacterized DUF497 family protein
MGICMGNKRMKQTRFEWNPKKNELNIEKHGVNFYEAQHAFLDKRRIVAQDLGHSSCEQRYFCFGKVLNQVMTVRFTWRNKIIRIIGAGYWKKGKKIYDKAQKKI